MICTFDYRSESGRSRESTPGKSLRFNVPKRLPPMNLDEAMDEATNEDQEGSESSSDLEILDDVEVVPDTEADDTFQEKAIQEGVSRKYFFIFLVAAPLVRASLGDTF